MKSFITCGLFLLAFSVQADQGLIDTTKQAVAQDMKDPDSAQFKNMTVRDTGKTRVVCGEVNAKNSYGGYVGFTKFYKYESSPHAVLKKGDPIMDQLVDAVCKPA